MEHRFGHRIAVFEPVFLRGPAGELTEAALTEISLSGAWIRTPARWPVLCHLHVLVPHEPGTEGAALTVLPAQVIRHATDGLAIAWLELAPKVVRARLGARTTRSSN